jgi:DNA invertase Pin-like site-specific DNA recombinase
VSAQRRLRAVTDAPLRFGIAVRVSRVMGRGGDTFHSPETQETAARRAVVAAGGVVEEGVGASGVFFDLDVSGAIAPSDRPGLGEALELVRAGRLDGIALYDLSRWSRETVAGLRELEQVAALGGQVLSASETIDLATPAGRFSTTVQLAAHQMRRDEASRAWRATHAARHEQGKPHGTVPLGYLRHDGQVIVDPVLGPAVRQAFLDYAAGLVSQMDIAKRLGPLRGRRVWQSTVSDMLRSPFYIGQVRLNGQTAPGRHEPLVADEVWHAARRRLEREGQGPVRVRSASHSLAGLLVCDLCDHAMWQRKPGYQREHLGRPVLVTCRTKRETGGCAGVGTPRFDLIEQEVLAAVLRDAARLRSDANALAARQSEQARATVDVTGLRAELAELEAAVGRAGVLLARAVMTESAYQSTVSELDEAAASVRARLLAAEDTATAPRPAALLNAAEQLERLWPRMTSTERRAALRPFVSQVRVGPTERRGQPIAERLDVLDHQRRPM